MDHELTADAHWMRDDRDASTAEVLGELQTFLAERIIPRLPSSCEWRWVALRFEHALRRAGAPPR